MIRWSAAFFLLSTMLSGSFVFARPGVAETLSQTPVMTGRSVSCDTVEPVCAVMKDKRLVPYQSECRARAEGAQRILFGYCSDAD